MFNKLLFVIFFIFSFSGCDNQKVDRTGIKEEKERRTLKKVSEAEILNEASNIGKKIALDAEKLINSKSQDYLNNINQTEINKAIINRIHDMDSLEKAYETEIQYLSFITSNKDQVISPIEAELLDAYQYNIDKNISLSENIQKINKDYLLYNKPLIIENPSCLRCHGMPGKDVSEQTLTALKQFSSSSQITGYTLGSVVGFWSIRLSQKKIVLGL